MSGLVGILPTAPILADEIPQGESGDAALPDGLTHAEWRHIQEQISRADFGLTWRDTGATHTAPQALTPTTLLIPQVAKLTAPDGAAYDLFGNAIALDGNFFVVGAYLDDDNGDASGSVYVFGRNQGGEDNWGQVAKALPTDGAPEDSFGLAVALDGNVLAVSAYLDDDNGPDSGSVYIFERNQGGADNWGQVAKVTPTDGASGDLFGLAVALSGSNLVVGAPGDDDNGDTSGSAYVFARNEGGNSNWGQVAKLVPSDGAAYDGFGKAVALDGNALVVGAYRDDDDGADSGSVYVFARNEGGPSHWGQDDKITPSDGNALAEFGWAVTISGDTLVVGAHWDDDNGYASGSAYVFRRNYDGADGWGQVTKVLAPDGAAHDRFGRAVAVTGNILAVGACGDDDNGFASGSIYVFERNQGGAHNWGQAAKLIPSDGAVEDYFGWSVDVDGETFAGGAYLDDDRGDSSGSAYLFRPTEAANLSITQRVTTPSTSPGSQASAAPGDPITYTLTFTNAGPSPASDVSIADRLPLGVTGVISTYSAPISATPGLTYTWQVAELDVGEGGVITLSGVLGMGLASGHTLTNVVTITSTMIDADTSDNNYAASVTVLNAAPVAHGSSGVGFITDENSAFLTANVLNDGSDPNGDPVVVDSINTDDTLGLVSNHGDGSFGYDPNGQFAHLAAGERAFDSFAYTISDGVLSDTASVTITINGLNTPPLAVGDAYMTAFETPLNVPAATGVLNNDLDADSALLTVTLDSPPSNGTLVFEIDGSFTYTPSNSFTGPDSFSYHANDGLADSNAATVTLNVLDPTSADLEMRKDVDDPTPGAGDTIVYTLQVTNHGPADATNVTASDLLPSGLGYLAADVGYDPASGAWSVGNLSASASASLRITATVNGGTRGAVITNTASIGSCDQEDPLADNDRDEAVITVALVPTYTLTVNTVGQGLVNLNPDGGVYEAGRAVTLQAIPAPGWGLAGWSGGLGSAEQVTVTVDSDRTITATFEQVTFSLYLPLVTTSSS